MQNYLLLQSVSSLQYSKGARQARIIRMNSRPQAKYTHLLCRTKQGLKDGSYLLMPHGAECPQLSDA
jgi:hypothetical protein